MKGSTTSSRRLLSAPSVTTGMNVVLVESPLRHLANSLTLGSLALALGSLGLACVAALTDDPPVTSQIVDSANKIEGVHRGLAKRVAVPFSDGSGVPQVAAGLPATKPDATAIRYRLRGEVDTDMVTSSLKLFPAGTAEDFRDLRQAIISSAPDALEPTKLEQFFVGHASEQPDFAWNDCALPTERIVCFRRSRKAAVYQVGQVRAGLY